MPTAYRRSTVAGSNHSLHVMFIQLRNGIKIRKQCYFINTGTQTVVPPIVIKSRSISPRRSVLWKQHQTSQCLKITGHLDRGFGRRIYWRSGSASMFIFAARKEYSPSATSLFASSGRSDISESFDVKRFARSGRRYKAQCPCGANRVTMKIDLQVDGEHARSGGDALCRYPVNLKNTASFIHLAK